MEGTKVGVEGPWLPPTKGQRRTVGGLVLQGLRVVGWTVGFVVLLLAAVWLWGDGMPG